MAAISAARLLASGCGVGFFPVAPGTAGSFVAVLVGAGLMRLSPAALPVAILLAAAAGFWAVARVGRDDPGWVVIDEFAGQWIAMLALPLGASWMGLAASFLLFRLFDIAKPGPVGWLDRRPGAVGVMSDDLAAGAIAAALLGLVRIMRPDWLG